MKNARAAIIWGYDIPKEEFLELLEMEQEIA